MDRLCKFSIIGELLILILLVGTPAHSKPWRNVGPISASDISWKEGIGICGGDRTRLYSLTGRGSLSVLPFLGGNKYPDGMQEAITSWVAAHPEARAVPVEAYPFLSNSVGRIYVWLVDGDQNLNVHLLKEGFFRASNLLPYLRTEDLLIPPKEMLAFRKKISAFEIAAAKAGKGIWAQGEVDPGFPAGSLEYPGMTPLAELEGMAEAEDETKYGPKASEKELIRIGNGNDNAAAWAALRELDRRAKAGTISSQGFDSLISAGLERQGDPRRDWQHFFGSLLDLAYQQGRLSKAQIDRYTRQAILPSFKIHVMPDKVEPLILIVSGGDRIGESRSMNIRPGDSETRPLLTVEGRFEQLKIDGIPVRKLEKIGQGIQIFWYQINGVNGNQGFRAWPEQRLSPGSHTLTGLLETRIFTGIDPWNAAGMGRSHAGDNPPAATHRWEIESSFTMHE